MKDKVHKTSEIKIKVGLNENKVPARIDWIAEDSGEKRECKAMLLSMFDSSSKETLKIDLWTTEMQVIEMDRFMYQTLRSLADTYFKSHAKQSISG